MVRQTVKQRRAWLQSLREREFQARCRFCKQPFKTAARFGVDRDLCSFDCEMDQRDVIDMMNELRKSAHAKARP